MKRTKPVFIILTVAVIALGALMPAIVKITSSPQFCNSCHVMNKEYEHWRLTGLHREIKCVDCHLPNNNVINHLIWKGIDGTKDVVLFHTGLFDPSDIRATGHAKKVIQANCEKCHAGTVSLMPSTGRQCWSCHRRVNHTFPEISRVN